MTKAGHDLDVAVLTKVMGLRIGRGGSARNIYRVVGAGDDEPVGGWSTEEAAIDVGGCRFSRDDAAAMRVVDEMVRRELFPSIRLLSHLRWQASFTTSNGMTTHSSDDLDRRVAICLAALAAVES